MLYHVFSYLSYLPNLLPRTKRLIWLFVKYWLKDLWFYGSLLFSILFSVSSFLNKSADLDYSLLAMDNNDRVSYKVSYTCRQKIKNFDQLSAMLKARGINNQDRAEILNLISGKFSQNVLKDLDVDIEGEFDGQIGEYKLSSLKCKKIDLSFEILPNVREYLNNGLENISENNINKQTINKTLLEQNADQKAKNKKYILEVTSGDQVRKIKMNKVYSLKDLIRKVNSMEYSIIKNADANAKNSFISIDENDSKIIIPFSIAQQCKKAYMVNQFKFDPKLPTYIIYQNPGKALNDYKLLLLANGNNLDQLQGSVLISRQITVRNAGKNKKSNRIRYLEAFEHLGQIVSYKKHESIRYEDYKDDNNYLHPLPMGILTSGFGYRTRPRKGFHYGVDFSAPRGAIVKCALGGKVIMAQRYGAYGNVVIVANGCVKTVYAHLHHIKVNPNSYVQTGQIVGTVGSTGRSTGTHLHFEIRKNNKPVNPLDYLKGGANSIKKQAIKEVRKEKIMLSESKEATLMKKTLLSKLFN